MKVFFEKDLRLHQLCNATQQPGFPGALVVVTFLALILIFSRIDINNQGQQFL